MSYFEQYTWGSEDKRTDELSDKEILWIYFLKKITPFLTFITRFFPFSLLWRDRRFHYRFKEVVEADDLIMKIASKKRFWFKILSFEREEKFLRIVGKFTPLRKGAKKGKLMEHFEKIFADEGVYVQRRNDNTVQFLFIRE